MEAQHSAVITPIFCGGTVRGREIIVITTIRLFFIWPVHVALQGGPNVNTAACSCGKAAAAAKGRRRRRRPSLKGAAAAGGGDIKKNNLCLIS